MNSKRCNLLKVGNKFLISNKYSILHTSTNCAHCFFVRDLKDNNNDESEDEKESNDKGFELSTDSELSLGDDEPLMEVQVSLDTCSLIV